MCCFLHQFQALAEVHNEVLDVGDDAPGGEAAPVRELVDGELRDVHTVEIHLANGAVRQVVLATGAVYDVRAVILATGTYLKGRTIIGTCVEDSGPDGMHAAGRLTDSLLKLGLPLRRFKTGTPPRVNARSVDFDVMELQEGDRLPVPFSYSTRETPENKAVCYLTWTTEETLRIVRENLDKIKQGSRDFRF